MFTLFWSRTLRLSQALAQCGTSWLTVVLLVLRGFIVFHCLGLLDYVGSLYYVDSCGFIVLCRFINLDEEMIPSTLDSPSLPPFLRRTGVHICCQPYS